jgi:GNAT superfamily N-acetyltransferase
MMPPPTQPWTIRPLTTADREAVRQFTLEHWGADCVVAHGVAYFPETFPGFVAVESDIWLGLITYCLQDNACEVVTLDSAQAGQGIGTALLEAVRHVAQQRQCQRLWLITTNDNLDALRFYQRRGLELAQVHRGALALSRARKPTIPLVGAYGIPLRDEIELELILNYGPQTL